MTLETIERISKSFSFFVLNKRVTGDIARGSDVLWGEKPCFTCRKEEIGQPQPLFRQEYANRPKGIRIV